MADRFRFKVVYRPATLEEENIAGRDTPAGWEVYLPHQCDAWQIAGDHGDPVPHEQAVADLREFIAEAQAALETLESNNQKEK